MIIDKLYIKLGYTEFSASDITIDAFNTIINEFLIKVLEHNQKNKNNIYTTSSTWYMVYPAIKTYIDVGKDIIGKK